MRVVHLSTTDFGGAYKAAKRINEAMNICGADSQVFVRSKSGNDVDTEELFTTFHERFFSKVKNFLNLLLSKGEFVTDYFGCDLTKYPQVMQADVVFLHWVNSFVSYKSVEKLAKTGRKIVWVMHDMWLFTGGCHYDHYCGNYEFGCGNCPMLGGRKDKDKSRKAFERKKRMLLYSNIVLTGPSEWICDCARNSDITNEKQITCIHNPLDTAKFIPRNDKDKLLKKYGMNQEKKIILFGAMKALTSSYKGYPFLKSSIDLLDSKKYSLLIYGNKTEDEQLSAKFETKYMGYISDEQVMVELYNLADVFVCPSSQESFCYAVLEARACGAPVTAFAIGGITDQIVHKENGFLAKYQNIEEFAEGIEYCVDHLDEMHDNARNSALENNTYEIIGEKYIDLIEKNE